MKNARLGPLALTTTATTNIFNPPTATGGTNGGSSAQYALFTLIRLINKSAVAATATLYLGATGANAAGTELCLGKNVPANDWVDMYFPGLRVDSADFIVGFASANTSITLVGVYKMVVAG